MRLFACSHCDAVVFFENVSCLACGHILGWLSEEATLGTFHLEADGTYRRLRGTSGADRLPVADASVRYRKCRHYAQEQVCNGMVPADAGHDLCAACQLTRTVPDLQVAGNRERWQQLELAKRRLLYGLHALRVPVRWWSPGSKLRFDFLASTPQQRVTTGHQDGLITIDLAEADDAVREQVRTALGERYRTLLGHVRHESGHYFWSCLLENSPRLDGFRALFGDERVDYGEAMRRYYASGPAPDWSQRCISAYASMHPWEDWAETWAHYLHLVDAVEAGGQFGLALSPHPQAVPRPSQRIRLPTAAPASFADLIHAWIPLTTAINLLNRSMGWPDWYPFVLTEPVLGKLCFIHELLHAVAGEPAPSVAASRTPTANPPGSEVLAGSAPHR